MRQFPLLVLFLLATSFSFGQTLNGMATGNYAGITGLTFNPASIIDSRYKFDLNIASAQFYFSNNYLYAKPLLFARSMLKNDPYNSSFAAVKQDLMSPAEPAPTDKVYARQSTEFLFPLSFMLTTGKRSAMALTLRNRYELTVDNLNPSTARMMYNELNDPQLQGVMMDNSGFENKFLNWQEIGLTYGRVLINANKHFIKLALTAKWLGGNAAGYIQADQLGVSFANPHTMSLVSPSIQYARTARADFHLFDRTSIMTDLESSSVGFDAGLVYEFRGRIGNFRYTDEDYQSRLRRDKNKYTLRLGIALNDVGVLNFDRLPLTRDHSARINNWDFSGVKASSLSDFDTAYMKQVSIDTRSPTDFSVALPTAVIANVDLHLFGGLYINAAAQRRLISVGKSSTARMFTGEWFAVTPRFEGRWFGLYIPVMVREKSIAQVGTTLRFGPVYVGSNNLLNLVRNKQVSVADVHAGIRLPIGFGKPTKMLKAIEKESGLKLTEEEEEWMDSITTRTAVLESRVAMLEKMADSNFRKPSTVIVNNYLVDSAGKQQLQSQISQSNNAATTTSQPIATQASKAQIDSLTGENERLRKEAEKKMEKEGVKPPKEPKPAKNDKKAKKQQERYEKEQRQYEKAMQEEMKKLRRQQAITGTAIAGAITANAIVDGKNGAVKTDTIVKRDTVVVEKIKRDTVYVKDTTGAQPEVGPGHARQPQATVSKSAIPEVRTARVYFAIGSAVISKSYQTQLNKVAAWMLQNPGRRALVTGTTDATGSPEVNKVLAQKRVDAVINAMTMRGIDASRFDQKVNVSTERTTKSSSVNRRVDITAQ